MAITAYALVSGLSDQRHHGAVRDADNAAATATPPETISQASSDYDPASLQAPRDMLWGDHPPPEAEGAHLNPPNDPNLANAPASSPGHAPTAPTVAPDPQHAANASPILFSEHRGGAQGAAYAQATSANSADGARGNFLAGQRAAQSANLPSMAVPPRSRYELQSGAVISAALLTALNSDLPGRVIAQVTAPVYDTVTGTQVLVPQGARLIGVYDSTTTHGDNRILLVWNRLLFPNGWSLDLGGMDATDPSGAAGLRDRVDNHLGPLAGAIGLASIFSVLGNNAENDHDNHDVGQTVGDSAAQQAAQTGGRIVDRDLQRHPTLQVRAGAPVRVLVTRDITLRPYRAR